MRRKFLRAANGDCNDTYDVVFLKRVVGYEQNIVKKRGYL